MTIKDDLLARIRKQPGDPTPTLVAALRALGHKTAGDYAIEIMPNLILWTGMSYPVVEAFGQIKTSRIAHAHPLSQMEAFLVHGCDGAPMLALPYAARPPKGGYKKLHWVSAVWYPGSSANCRTCRDRQRPARRPALSPRLAQATG